MIWASIDALDFGPIRFKLVHSEGWDMNTVQITETWYKRFLYICAKYPNERIAPTKTIDEFWHYHILDTRKYADDCQEVFGMFLHHFPYFGMRGGDDANRLQEAGDRLSHLMELEFGEPMSVLRESISLCGPENCDPSHQTVSERVRPSLSVVAVS